jgi:hypothetical protein
MASAVSIFCGYVLGSIEILASSAAIEENDDFRRLINRGKGLSLRGGIVCLCMPCVGRASSSALHSSERRWSKIASVVFFEVFQFFSSAEIGRLSPMVKSSKSRIQKDCSTQMQMHTDLSPYARFLCRGCRSVYFWPIFVVNFVSS